MATSYPISVCMIAGAEAPRIRRALTSVSEWAGEIIVVMNEDVADGTDAIAASFGAKTFREPWKGHVAQKNSAASKANSPWLLGLDADEEVSPLLRAEIIRVLQHPEDPHAAYQFPRCTQYAGRWIRHGDWYPDRQTRLWRRGQGHWGGIDPHDRLEVQGAVGRLRGDLYHYSIDTLDHYMAKLGKYADDFARDCALRQRQVGVGDLMLRPWWRWIRGYVLKLGFLDGWQGYSVAWISAFYTHLRYLKAREAQEKRRLSP